MPQCRRLPNFINSRPNWIVNNERLFSYQVRLRPNPNCFRSTSNDMALADGEILVKVDRFGFSANNITYGIAGDTLGYWQFFPVEDGSQTWASLRFGDLCHVIESNGSSIEKGERLLGLFPSCRHCYNEACRYQAGHVFRGRRHRAELPRAYNSYQRVLKEPGYDTKIRQCPHAAFSPLSYFLRPGSR